MKQEFPTKILWLDLEMTGLNPERDIILEVAAILTDWDFNEIASYESTALHDIDTVRKLLDSNPWWSEQGEAKEQLLSEIENGKDLAQIESELLALMTEHTDEGMVLLAGNSIHQDRRFIRKAWPNLDEKLHYRMLDVSAWKVVMASKYKLMYDKASVHRAMDDIRESIDELKFYLTKLK